MVYNTWPPQVALQQCQVNATWSVRIAGYAQERPLGNWQLKLTHVANSMQLVQHDAMRPDCHWHMPGRTLGNRLEQTKLPGK
eukprot:1358757-Lingulodinium_polyedra.AAC.1